MAQAYIDANPDEYSAESLFSALCPVLFFQSHATCPQSNQTSVELIANDKLTDPKAAIAMSVVGDPNENRFSKEEIQVAHRAQNPGEDKVPMQKSKPETFQGISTTKIVMLVIIII